MPRKLRLSGSESARRTHNDDSRRAQPPEGPSGHIPIVWLVVFAAITIAYLAAFYGSDRPQAPVDMPVQLGPRRTALLFLLAPDDLVRMWCGGKWEYFSLLDRWPIAAFTAVILAGAWLAGRLALRLLGGAGTLDRLSFHVFAIGVGLNLMSLYALAVGLAGGLAQRWLFVLPLVLLVAANVPAVWQTAAGDQRDVRGDARATGDNDPRWWWWLAAAAPFAVVVILGGMIPPVAYDVREYHLQAPKEWFLSGRIGFLPHNIYANMPLGSELNSLWAMALAGGEDGWWWGAITGKTVMACYSLVAAAGLVAFGRRLHSLAAGAVAAALYLSTPWIIELAKSGYNEGPVAMYALLAIYALWLAQHEADPAMQWRRFALAGFCAGSAVACKYPPALFLVAPLTGWVAMRSPVDRHAARSVVIFLAAAAAACGLWFGKNLVLTKNPTYPLLYSLFDGCTRTPEKDRQWTRVHSPQPDKYGNRFSLADLRNQLAWLGWRTPWAGVSLVPLATMAWLARPQRRLTGAVALWMLFVFAAWWLFTHRLDRFLMLLIPLAALLAALGALALSHPAWRAATLGLVAWGLISQFTLVTLSSDNRFFAPLVGLRRDDPDLGFEGGRRLHPAHRWLNEHAQPGERVLLVGDAEPFELNIDAVYNTCFDDCQFTRLFQGRTRDQRLEALANERIRYVFFHWPHLARYRSAGNYGYTSDYPTPALVHHELVNEQGLLEKIDIDLPPDRGELFRVKGLVPAGP